VAAIWSRTTPFGMPVVPEGVENVERVGSASTGRQGADRLGVERGDAAALPSRGSRPGLSAPPSSCGRCKIRQALRFGSCEIDRRIEQRLVRHDGAAPLDAARGGEDQLRLASRRAASRVPFAANPPKTTEWIAPMARAGIHRKQRLPATIGI